MTSEPVVPRLSAVTRPLSVTPGEAPDLIALADPESPLVWARGDRACVGIGEVLRLTFSGADRFQDATQAWRRIAAAASVDDRVRLPGTGLVALGTFAFADDSRAESMLIVPRKLIAQHREQWWVTEIAEIGGRADGGSDAGADAGSTAASTGGDPELPAGAAARPWPGTSFTPRPQGAVDSYLGGVREAVERIAHGEAEKIVLARQTVGHIAVASDLRVPLRRLANRYLDCWTFAVDGLIGASPETLIRSTNGAVSARVLAGTRGRHADDDVRDAHARNELLTSAKEQHEHAFAVQSVVTALSPYVRDLHTSEEPFPLQLPNVWHLATDLGAVLGERSAAIELAGALHPTAAVAGTPTSAAVEAIAQLEPFDRGRYAGAVGWIDGSGDGEWVIALRCCEVGPIDTESGCREVIATAGGGIVEGSDPERELRETVSKFQPVTEAFAPQPAALYPTEP